MPDDFDNVVSLDEARVLREFEADENVAYLEILWGKGTFAVNAAIRNLEKVRRDEDDGGVLRDPETEYEMRTLLERTRWVCNFLARKAGLEDQVRPDDWLGDERSLEEVMDEEEE